MTSRDKKFYSKDSKSLKMGRDGIEKEEGERGKVRRRWGEIENRRGFL